jgi:hypothetical protein
MPHNGKVHRHRQDQVHKALQRISIADCDWSLGRAQHTIKRVVVFYQSNPGKHIFGRKHLQVIFLVSWELLELLYSFKDILYIEFHIFF